MCSENEPDRHVGDAQDRAQETRRLFERYRAASRHETAATVEAGVQAPGSRNRR